MRGLFRTGTELGGEAGAATTNKASRTVSW